MQFHPAGNHHAIASLMLGLLVFGLASVSEANAAGPSGEMQVEKKRPNIIFILTDDLGYGDLGSYGQDHIKTPNLDRMAAEGMRFTQFYAGSTICAPTRCVLMTGLHTGRCPIRGNGEIVSLKPRDMTVGEVLRTSGYTTALIGKWGLGDKGSQGTPNKQGFDYFFGFLNHAHAHNHYPHFLTKNGKRVPLKNIAPHPGEHGEGVATRKLEYAHDLFTEEALAYIDRTEDQRFFLFLSYTIPHANNEAEGNGMEVPDYGIYADEPWPDAQKGLAAMISRLDRDVGRLIERLQRHGIDRDTIIFFSSDNGPHAEGGNDPNFFDSNGPLRGFKRDLYEGGIRVPMIVRWPGKVQAGSISDHVGFLGDFLPTAASLAGYEAKLAVDGISFLPILLGKRDRQKPHKSLYWEFYARGGMQAIRMGNWKAVRRPMWGEIELYDLAADIGERNDVADQHPDVVAMVDHLMREAHVPSSRWQPTYGGGVMGFIKNQLCPLAFIESLCVGRRPLLRDGAAAIARQ